MSHRVKIQVTTSYLRERARLAEQGDDWGEVAMFTSLASELDELRALAAELVDVPHYIEFTDDGRYRLEIGPDGGLAIDLESHEEVARG